LLLDLDRLMVRSATLQSDYLLALCRTQSSELRGLKHEAKAIDLALKTWSECLHEDWKIASFDQSTMWMRYCAVRMLVNDIHIHVLLSSISPEEQDVKTFDQVNACEHKVRKLADDICSSSQFFFRDSQAARCRSDPNSDSGSSLANQGTPSIEPKMAAILAWPLSMALKTRYLQEAQRRGMVIMMGAIASALPVIHHCLLGLFN
jgi:hypothetical protein